MKRSWALIRQTNNALLLLLALLAYQGQPEIALAQIIPSIDGLAPDQPPPVTVRELGVDVSTSAIHYQNQDISIGSGDFPSRLDLIRSYDMVGYPLKNHGGTVSSDKAFVGLGMGGHLNLVSYFSCNNCLKGETIYAKAVAAGSDPAKRFVITVTALGKSYHFDTPFLSSTSTLTAEGNEGATFTVLHPAGLSYVEYLLTTKEGIRVYFSDSGQYNADIYAGRFARYAEFPNGEFIVFMYAPSPYSTGSMRLSSIVNSKGYGFNFLYSGSSGLNWNSLENTANNDNSLLTGVSSFRSVCSTSANVNCSSGTMANISYAYSGANLTSFTDPMGNQTQYTYDQQSRISSISHQNTLSVAGIPSTSFLYTSWVFDVTVHRSYGVTFPNGVGSPIYLGALIQDSDYVAYGSTPATIKDGVGNTTIFAFNLPDYINPVSVTIGYPDGNSRYYLSKYCEHQPNDTMGCLLSPWYVRAPTLFKDGLGGTTIYAYDGYGRATAVNRPEGDSVKVTRDSNGNITEARHTAKPGSGLPDVVTTAGYTSCDSINFRWCNKPSYTIDPNGNRSDFKYDDNSGEILVALLPADSSNKRPVVRYTYSPFAYANLPQGAGIFPPSVTTPPTVYLLTAKDTCLTSTIMGTSVDFTYTCSAGNRRRETFNYVASTTSSRTSYELISSVADADNIAATTQYVYDAVGNVTSVTDPNGNTSYTTYDASRRKIFEIGPNPGSGNPRQIVKHVYDGDGNEIRTEFGTGTSTNGSDFVLVRHKQMKFDGNDRLIQVQEVVP